MPDGGADGYRDEFGVGYQDASGSVVCGDTGESEKRGFEKELKAPEQVPLIMLLDNLQDPGNMGTILRTAEAAAVTGIIMSSDCVDVYNPKVIRSTMGSVFRVPFVYVENVTDVIRQMKEHGIRTYATHLAGELAYDEPDYRTPSAFFVGNEGNGLRDQVAELADTYIKIPMAGQVESLNAAIAANGSDV